MKLNQYKNAYVISYREGSWWNVALRSESGNLIDRVRCDTYRGAMEYRRAFCAIAKQFKG